MDLNIRQLRYFVAIAATGTFSRAAAETFITTPSLSQQIAKLERQLGFRLFDRGPKGTRLTADGEAFIDVAQELLRAHDRAVQRAQERRSALPVEPVTTFRLGFQVGMVGTSTADILAEFRALEPTCELILTQLNWSQQIAGVANGTLDAALVRPPLPPSSLQVIPLIREPRALVTSRRHPLATRETITIADLGDVVQVRAA
jgi:DNA-binding transcriptional LysR family regulator